jgi:glycosyltransferase involved in cell wall biosynthesis
MLNLPDIYFLGRVPKNDLVYAYLSADIFVFPSLRKGLPLSVLEAMACGLPVVGFDVPGMNDVIVNGENGLLVPARDPKALANAVLALLNDEDLRRELGQKARKLVVEKYNWDTVISKIEKIYYEAIKET